MSWLEYKQNVSILLSMFPSIVVSLLFNITFANKTWGLSVIANVCDRTLCVWSETVTYRSSSSHKLTPPRGRGVFWSLRPLREDVFLSLQTLPPFLSIVSHFLCFLFRPDWCLSRLKVEVNYHTQVCMRLSKVVRSILWRVPWFQSENLKERRT